jgi:hypothetical protein
MRKSLFFIVIAIVSIGVIVLNTNNTVKYLVCEDPNNYISIIDEVNNDSVVITVDTTSSAETFSDYVYHIEEGTLFIGVKYALNPLNDDATGRYTITIDTDTEIDTIILKGANEEEIIYPE